MDKSISLWFLDAISGVFSTYILGPLITFVGILIAVYLAELMIVGKKRSSIKATLIIAFIYTIIAEIAAILLSSIPILTIFVQIITMAFLIMRYFEENWFVIFALALVLNFAIWIALSLVTVLFTSTRP